MPNREHLIMLYQGVAAWNKWRKEHRRVTPNLQKASLCGKDLSKIDFRKANLQKADLSQANLQKADLREANLERAHLKMAKIDGADFRGARLNEAIATGISFECARINKRDLRGVILNLEDFKKKRRQKAQLNYGDKDAGKPFWESNDNEHPPWIP